MRNLQLGAPVDPESFARRLRIDPCTSEYRASIAGGVARIEKVGDPHNGKLVRSIKILLENQMLLSSDQLRLKIDIHLIRFMSSVGPDPK